MVRQGGQVWLPARARGFASFVWGGRGGLSPPALDPGPWSRQAEVTPSPGSRAPGSPEPRTSCAMLEGDIGLEGLSPKEDPAAREYPGAAQGGEGPPSPAAAASGTPGDGGFSGTEGHTRGRRQGPLSRCRRTAPALFPGEEGYFVGRRSLGAPTEGQKADRPRTGLGPGWGWVGAGGGRAPLWALPGRPAIPQSQESIPQPCPVHRQADGRISDVFTGAINTHNISVLFWRFICDIKLLL